MLFFLVLFFYFEVAALGPHRTSCPLQVEKLRPQTHLVAGEDLEGGDDLVRRVRVGRFPGHEVDEGLEGDEARVVGVYDAHDAVKLSVALATKKHTHTG